MYQATFTLRQETPLIHFLHDQPGATLRATEVKPRLDKWISKKHPDLSDRHSEWISKIGEKGHHSFDYKISIKPTGTEHQVRLSVTEKYDPKSSKNKLETTAFPHLLGNMGGKEYMDDLKNLVLYSGAEVLIQTWHEELLDIIRIELPNLLANENFGNRSSKGFGSFTCLKINGATVNVRPAWRYRFDWEVQGNNIFQQQKDLFSAINWFYKCLRSGINQVNRDRKTEFYFKSLMYAFAEKQGEKWDKHTIKNHFFKGGNIVNEVDYRDWLGLSTEEMWGRDYAYQTIKKTGEKSGIERFPSPLTFKPIRIQGSKFKIYIGIAETLESSFNEFKGATIEVSTKNNSTPLNLKPSARFNHAQFLQFALEETNIKEHLDRFDNLGLNGSRHWIYQDFIHPIFNSIHQNLHQTNP